MVEIAELRTVNRRTFLLNDGRRSTEFHAKPIFFQDGANLTPLEIGFTDQGTHFEAVKNGTKVRVIKDFQAPVLIAINNDWDNAGQYITFDARQLLWVNQNDYTDFQVFRAPQAVTGVLNGDKIRFTNAWGAGIHFEVQVTRTQMRKYIVIDSLASLGVPPTAQHQLVATFKWGGNVTDIRRKDDGQVFSGGVLQSEYGFNLGGLSQIRRPVIKDSSIMENPRYIPVFWREVGVEVIQAKVLPRNYLLNATFPVRADATFAPLTGATTDDGSTLTTNTNRTTARTNSTTSYAQENDADYWGIVCEKDGSNYQYAQSYFQFDTSSIPDTDTIDSGDLKVYTYGASGLVADGYTQKLVGHTITDNGTNYGNKANNNGSTSATEYTTLYSDDAISPATSATQYTWNLNTAGKSYINKTGNTLFCLRLNGDIDDSAPTGRNLHRTYFEESASDPVLTVTHSAGGGSTLSTLMLMGMGA